MSWYFHVHIFSLCKRPADAKDKIFQTKQILYLKEKQVWISILHHLLSENLLKEIRIMNTGPRDLDSAPNFSALLPGTII